MWTVEYVTQSGIRCRFSNIARWDEANMQVNIAMRERSTSIKVEQHAPAPATEGAPTVIDGILQAHTGAWSIIVDTLNEVVPDWHAHGSKSPVEYAVQAIKRLAVSAESDDKRAWRELADAITAAYPSFWKDKTKSLQANLIDAVAALGHARRAGD